MGRKKPVIVSIVGARPQFVKLAPLARELKKSFRHIVIHTGQHYDFNMSDSFFTDLKIPQPDINLGIGSGPHGQQTGRLLEKCEKALLKIKPDMVLVYGDTNSTLAGALAAAKLLIPIGHIEAGLRSFRRDMPEEVNRVLTDHLSNLLFYPTPVARKNLIAEGIKGGRALISSGDLMYEILDQRLKSLKNKDKLLNQYGLQPEKYILVTLHRAENSDFPKRLEMFKNILKATDLPIIFPAHPRTMKNLKKFKLLSDFKKIQNLRIIPPLPYLEMLALMSQAKYVMTDSGGMQKEAFFLRRPCLTLRPETEWVETVTTGRNFLIDMSITKLRRAMGQKMKSRGKFNYRINRLKPSEVITRAISGYLKSLNVG